MARQLLAEKVSGFSFCSVTEKEHMLDVLNNEKFLSLRDSNNLESSIRQFCKALRISRNDQNKNLYRKIYI